MTRLLWGQTLLSLTGSSYEKNSGQGLPFIEEIHKIGEEVAILSNDGLVIWSENQIDCRALNFDYFPGTLVSITVPR